MAEAASDERIVAPDGFDFRLAVAERDDNAAAWGLAP